MKILGELTGINIYPVKSLPPIVVQTAHMTRYGIAHPDNKKVVDRKWMLIDKKGGFLSQRRVPRMALIKQQYKNERICLSAPGMEDISFPVEMPKTQVACRLWSSSLTLYSYGSELAAWLSKFLEEDGLDLVSFGDEALNERNKPEYDFHLFMLLSEASLADLNLRLENKVDIKNFRCNLFAKNVPLAYGEVDSYS